MGHYNRPLLPVCFVLLSTVGAHVSAVADSRFIRGDTNCDNKFTIADPIFSLGWTFQGSEGPCCMDAADVNDDGSVDLSDAVFALNFLFLAGFPPRDPYPDCGNDPSLDPLACESFPPCAPPPDLPTEFEGYGAVTLGAESSPDGYEVYHVTSLANDGPGTLRDAVSAGNRYVVFDVAGTIVLESDLNIPWSYITLDGASAPSPGITIVQPDNIGTMLEATHRAGPIHDVIIHHLRMDGQASEHTNRGDIWGLDGEKAPVFNVVIDHVTAIAATDGAFDIWDEVRDVTFSWNLIVDTVTACHLAGGTTGTHRERISFLHNVFARNNERQVKFRFHNEQIDFVNNVIYGWGWMEGGASGLWIAYDAGQRNTSINVISNFFHHVPGLHGRAGNAVIFDRGAAEGRVYFEGNIVPVGEDDVKSNALSGSPVPEYAQATRFEARTLHDTVVPQVGTHYPTEEETQLLREIADAVRYD